MYLPGASRRRPNMRIRTAIWAALIVCSSVLFATIGIPFAAYSLTPWTAAAPIMALVVVPPVSSWSVRALRRFCGRLIPLSSSGNRMFAPRLACMAGCVFAFIAVLNSIQRLVTLRDVATWFESGGVLVIAAGTFCIALALQACQYFRPTAVRTPYILILRTFLGFSDRAVTAALFTIVGGRNPIAVLTAPHSNSASWDPVLIAFRGNPILQLSAKSPVFLRAADHEWERSVRNLVDGASHVVVDISDMSSGVRAEVEMVGREGISNKVIWLSDAAQSDRLPQIRALVGSAHMPADRVIFYERSWTAALPNLLIGLCLSELFVFTFLLLSDGFLRSVATLRDLGYVDLDISPARAFRACCFSLRFLPARPSIDTLRESSGRYSPVRRAFVCALWPFDCRFHRVPQLIATLVSTTTASSAQRTSASARRLTSCGGRAWRFLAWHLSSAS